MTDRWTAVYDRWGQRGSESCPSLDAAIHFLWMQEDLGQLASVEVLAPDGTVYLTLRQIRRVFEEVSDNGEWSAETSPTIAARNAPPAEREPLPPCTDPDCPNARPGMNHVHYRESP